MPYDAESARGYDARHAARAAEAETVAHVLAELAAEAGGGPVLELGIGTGRIALPLAAAGVEVHGIDSSEAMVNQLRAKPGGEAVPVVMGDFADVGALVDRQYGVVAVVFNTLFELGSQDDQTRCLAGVARSLRPGGLLVVEALAPDVTRLEQTLSVVDITPESVTLQATSHDPLNQRVTGHDIVVRGGAVRLSPWAIRYATVPELDLMAGQAGLRLKHRWGGWAGQAFTAASTHHVSVYEHRR